MVDIFDQLEASAEKMGGCEPRWLKNRETPEFITVEANNGHPPILLFHGLFGALSNWEQLTPEIDSFSNPIALSFPILSGHRSEVRVKALAVYAEYFIRSRKLDPVVLCGNSLGGHVAMRLCLAAPELVDCLILSGTSGLYEHSVDTLPVRPDEKYVRDHMRRVFFNSEFITDDRVDEIAQILKSRMNTLNLIHAARSAKKDNLKEHLKEIAVPTLLLWGDDDEVTTLGVGKQFHESIPGSEFHSVKNCGHAPMIEHPKWFGETMKEFLKRNSKAFAHI